MCSRQLDGDQVTEVHSRRTSGSKRRLVATLELIRQGRWKPPSAHSVVEPKHDPTPHEFCDEWVERRRLEVGDRTVEYDVWALSHVLGVLGEVTRSRLTIERVDAYRTAKVQERERLDAAIAAWSLADTSSRGPRPPVGLGRGSINRTLRKLAAVLDDAVEYGLIASNPARGKRRRLKA